MDKKQLRANLLLFVAALIWGVAFVAQRVGDEHVGAMTFNAVRFLIGSASMVPLLIFLKRRPRPEGGADGVPMKKTLPVGLILGGVLFVASTLQQYGLYGTTAGKAGFITDLYIIFVPLFEVIFGRRLKKTIWLCIAMAAVGLYLISVTGKFTMSRGDFLVLLGSLVWTVHILLVDRFSKRYNPVRLCFLQYMVTAVVSLAAALFAEKITLAGLEAAAWPILYTGVFSVGIAYTLQIAGQRYAKASHAAIILSMESVVACIAGALILHESLGTRGVAGCVLMAGAMLLTQVGPAPKGKAETQKG